MTTIEMSTRKNVDENIVDQYNIDMQTSRDFFSSIQNYPDLKRLTCYSLSGIFLPLSGFRNNKYCCLVARPTILNISLLIESVLRLLCVFLKWFTFFFKLCRPHLFLSFQPTINELQSRAVLASSINLTELDRRSSVFGLNSLGSQQFTRWKISGS